VRLTCEGRLRIGAESGRTIVANQGARTVTPVAIASVGNLGGAEDSSASPSRASRPLAVADALRSPLVRPDVALGELGARFLACERIGTGRSMAWRAHGEGGANPSHGRAPFPWIRLRAERSLRQASPKRAALHNRSFLRVAIVPAGPANQRASADGAYKPLRRTAPSILRFPFHPLLLSQLCCLVRARPRPAGVHPILTDPPALQPQRFTCALHFPFFSAFREASLRSSSFNTRHSPTMRFSLVLLALLPVLAQEALAAPSAPPTGSVWARTARPNGAQGGNKFGGGKFGGGKFGGSQNAGKATNNGQTNNSANKGTQNGQTNNSASKGSNNGQSNNSTAATVSVPCLYALVSRR
jgi:hypothetical protein